MPPGRDPLVLEGLSVRYPRQAGTGPALHPCTLTLDPGQLVCLQGPSGAGKSTLLKALLGLVPARGRARLGSDVVSRPEGDRRDDYSAARRRLRARMSWVGQGSDLCDHLSALDNVAHGRLAETSLWRALTRGIPAATRDRSLEVLRGLGLDGLEHQKVRRLSGGQKQRVAIARALVQNSDWILADEPFSALDAAATRIALEAFQRERDAGRGLLLVLHDDRLAREIADRHLDVRDGHVSAREPVTA